MRQGSCNKGRCEIKFYPGIISVSQGVVRLAVDHDIDLFPLLQRHVEGDWGEMGLEDKCQNMVAMQEGGRMMSAYKTPHGEIWVITEPIEPPIDPKWRITTTFLLPSEY